MASRLCISPNEVEEMFLDRAEGLIEYWAAEAGASSSPMTPENLAARFGGKVIRGRHP